MIAICVLRLPSSTATLGHTRLISSSFCDDVSSAFDQRDQKVKGAGSNWYWFVVIEQKLL
jgi:hypothetical protein